MKVCCYNAALACNVMSHYVMQNNNKKSSVVYNVKPAISKVKVTSFLVTHCTVIIIITDDVMIMIVNNVDSTKLEYLNSAVTIVTYMYETIDTRCDTDWILKLSLILTTPSK